MSIEQAFHRRWSMYHTLTRVVPLERFVTGGQSGSNDGVLPPPYVHFSRLEDSRRTRTSSGTSLVTGKVAFAVWAASLPEAQAVADAVRQVFQGIDFSYDRGRVQDIKFVELRQVDHRDGMWEVVLHAQVRWSEEFQSVSA